MSYAYLIQGSNITVVINNKPHTISKSHPTYEKVKEAIKANDWDTVRNIIDPKKMVLSYGKGYLAIQGEKMFWKAKNSTMQCLAACSKCCKKICLLNLWFCSWKT